MFPEEFPISLCRENMLIKVHFCSCLAFMSISFTKAWENMYYQPSPAKIQSSVPLSFLYQGLGMHSRGNVLKLRTKMWKNLPEGEFPPKPSSERLCRAPEHEEVPVEPAWGGLAPSGAWFLQLTHLSPSPASPVLCFPLENDLGREARCGTLLQYSITSVPFTAGCIYGGSAYWREVLQHLSVRARI